MSKLRLSRSSLCYHVHVQRLTICNTLIFITEALLNIVTEFIKKCQFKLSPFYHVVYKFTNSYISFPTHLRLRETTDSPEQNESLVWTFKGSMSDYVPNMLMSIRALLQVICCHFHFQHPRHTSGLTFDSCPRSHLLHTVSVTTAPPSWGTAQPAALRTNAYNQPGTFLFILFFITKNRTPGGPPHTSAHLVRIRSEQEIEVLRCHCCPVCEWIGRNALQSPSAPRKPYSKNESRRGRTADRSRLRPKC